MADVAFGFLRRNARPPKPRRDALTEIRGPYYTPMGRRYLEDVLETMGAYIDSLKFAGGAFALYPRDRLTELIELCHSHDVKVSTGGFVETVLGQGERAVDRYLEECASLGFDVVEVSRGFVSLPLEDHVRLVERVRDAGLVPKPEVGIRFGAGGDSPEATNADIADPEWLLVQAERLLEAGAPLLMIESEGITENVAEWRTHIPARIVSRIGAKRVMFEAADPVVFAWYVKHFGADVNLFVDHSQIVRLEALRQGLWGTADVWGRVQTYRPPEAAPAKAPPSQDEAPGFVTGGQ